MLPEIRKLAEGWQSWKGFLGRVALQGLCRSFAVRATSCQYFHVLLSLEAAAGHCSLCRVKSLMKILTKRGGRDFWNCHVTMNILSIHPSLWEMNCYATLTCRAHLKLCFIFANTRDGSAEAAVKEAQVATKGESPWFLLHTPHYSLAVKSHCGHMGADSLEIETRGKGGQGFVTIALTLTSHHPPVIAWS